MLNILVDADACPVKDEIYKVAERYEVPVSLVSNAYMRIPKDSMIKMIVVNKDFDAADDKIVELSDAHAIVITADILLAERCIEKQSIVISPTGKPFTENSIGMAVATRAIMSDLRAGGEQVGRQAPFSQKDRSRFLSALDQAIVQLKGR